MVYYVSMTNLYKKIELCGKDYLIFSDGEIYKKVKQHNAKDYKIISVGGRNYEGKHFYVHRLLAQTFIENVNNHPFVDHINRNKLDNSLSNLRWVTKSENGINRNRRKDHKNNYVGVSWNNLKKKWLARIVRNGKDYFVGYYDEEVEAKKAREEYKGRMNIA